MRLLWRPNHALIAIALALIGLGSLGTAQAAPGRARATSGEIVIKLQPGVNAQAFAATNGLMPLKSDDDVIAGLSAYRFKIADGSSPNRKASQLANNKQVVYAEPNFESQIPEARQRSSWVVGGDDHAYAEQWAGTNIRLGDAHLRSRGGGITIAILDTGVDRDHPMLKPQLAGGYDFIGDDGDPQEEGTAGVDMAFGHGTHVAGLVALAAPGATIMPLRTLRPDGTGNIWTQVRALEYAAEHGADVINLSYSFGQSSRLLDEALAQVTCVSGGIADCRALSRPGVVVIAAAGNSGARVREYPAGEQLPGIIGVGASEPNDALAAFSTYGSWVQVMAPGDHILSTIPGGGYASWSGTSMATPLTAGVAAMVRAAYPTLRPADVVSRLMTTARQTDSLVRRRLDAAAALGMSAKRSP